MTSALIQILGFVAFLLGTKLSAAIVFNLTSKKQTRLIGTGFVWVLGLVLYAASGIPPAWWLVVMWALLVVVAVVVAVEPVRRALVIEPALKYFQKVLPPMSETEKAALEAGTVWWERELFSGAPDWRVLSDAPPAKLTDEEQAFIDGPVDTLCGMIDDWEVSSSDFDLQDQVWQYLRENRFFGMILPKKYGGLGFSAYAHSCVVLKIASRSSTGGVTAMVPNSLGPGLLLHEYGTPEQQAHYLPRLASGEEIPCFALTEPNAGSDAAGMVSHGVVCKQVVDGVETLGIRLNWDKRYITLAPVATVMGLAFKLFDPEHLIGDQEDVGITVALIPTNTPGVEIGQRHLPLNTPFMNGPIRGTDVFVDMNHIIGGVERVGQGWRMLMESLSDGRGISLPSLSAAGGKFCSMHTGGYARLRNQFNVSIGEFEGVKEGLALIAGNTYLMDAVRTLTAASIDAGEKPSVASAIAKYHLTERMRATVNAAMDIQGGSAICMGPRNPVGRNYQALPISITVEGANIVTRSLIIFGQGSVRAHPWILKEMEAAANSDRAQGLADFDEAIASHALMAMANISNSVLGGLCESAFIRTGSASPAARYQRRVSHLAASFCVLADFMMLRYGGALKRLEFFSSLLGDMLSALYMASAAIKHFQTRGELDADLPLLRWSIEDCERLFHNAANSILSNKPLGVLTPLLSLILYPLGRKRVSRNRVLENQLASIITTPSASRESLIAGIYRPTADDDHVARIERTFQLVAQHHKIERKFRKCVKTLDAWDVDFEQQIAEALAKQLLTEDEAEIVRAVHAARQDAIQVDEFAHDHWNKAALDKRAGRSLDEHLSAATPSKGGQS